ncbi:MAG: Holliday junction branch migration protein RuvA [Candidatus Eisenbacteria bacterium]
MIARLAGTLIEKSATASVVDVAGVGYALLHSLHTFEDLPAAGAPVTLVTYLHVREDALQLYGFSTAMERRVFELLLGVSGVGPKVALAVLSGLAPPSFARAIVDENVAALTRIAGVGRKTAERIVIDLRDKLGPAGLVPAPASAEPEAGPAGRGKGRAGALSAAAAPLPGRLHEDALGALIALGLTRPGALEAVHKALEHGPADGVEDLVRRALAAQAPKPGGRPRVGV